jgi:hypothetical protein
MELLLDRRGADIPITAEVLKAAVGNLNYGLQKMVSLLNRLNPGMAIIAKIVKALAEDLSEGRQMMFLLLTPHGDDIKITKQVTERGRYLPSYLGESRPLK